MSIANPKERGPALWTAGDWNAFFGFGTNILVNMLVLTGLLRFVLKMPDSLVFGRILPALGLMMCLSTFYYAFLAYRLAKRTGRSDVCALPSGVSVPHMFGAFLFALSRAPEMASATEEKESAAIAAVPAE
jgi:AGZA family xanthine/uracil permease-like MFS transporter